jgi:lipoyl(octanoyl) transferase
MSRCLVLEPGLVPFRQAWAWQQALVAHRQNGDGDDVLVLLEHPPTYTLGRRADPANLLASPAALAAAGSEVIEIDRGGDVTFHGPGQLVGYPILRLGPNERDYRGYIRRLEEVLIRAVGSFGLRGERLDGFSGVWCEGEKLAAIGVKISAGVTSHGFALNVDTDLGYFRRIVPCGIPDKPVGSLAQALGRRGQPAPARERLIDVLIDHFQDVFGRPCERLGPADSAARLAMLET